MPGHGNPYLSRPTWFLTEFLMIRFLLATRYLTPLREGGSLPAIVEAEDDELYVMKFAGAGQTASPAEYRTAYSDYLWRRLQASDLFLQEAIRAQH